MSGERPPTKKLTPDDRGAVVLVVSVVLITLTCIVTVVRYLIALNRRLALRADDATYITSFIFALASSACYMRAVTHGLGRHEDVLSENDIDRYSMYIYIGRLLGIVALAAAKFSIIFLFIRITVNHFRSYRLTFIFICVWAIFSVFVLSFQCGNIQKPWELHPEDCSTRGWLYLPVMVGNALTDIALAVIILPVLWRLNADSRMRVAMITLFSTRVIVPMLVVVQIAMVVLAIKSQDDESWDYFGVVLSELFVVHASVMTATFARTHNFWSKLDTGMAIVAVTNAQFEESNQVTSGSAQARQGSGSHNTSRGTQRRGGNENWSPSNTGIYPAPNGTSGSGGQEKYPPHAF